MKTITVETQQVDIYNRYDFPYENFTNCSTVEKSARAKKKYVDAICAFDIETTSIIDCKHPYGFMYVWQFAINETVCMGRTWEDYKNFITALQEYCNCTERKLVVYCHNLAFEFQFMRNFFDVGKIFSRSKRGVVYCEIDSVEYRCSYILSNMSLAKFINKSRNATFFKQDGKEFDYTVIRYPDTPLTDEELGYCVCDVLGLVQAIRDKLSDNDDTLATVPLTSTGYVRRDFREAMQSQMNCRDYMNKFKLNPKTYALCKEASRGAISGSNQLYSNMTVEDVDSEDIKSSYPFQMATKYFPSSKFTAYNARYGTEKLDSLLSNYCCIIVWSCSNLKVKQWEGIPYISKAKCRYIKGAKCGNGKVYSAERIGMCCTEIDFDIIRNHYNFEECVIHELWCAQRGMLPKPFRETLMNMFQVKTDLEDGDPYDYMKYKNKINAAFGMMLTDILHPEYVYIANSEKPWEEVKVENVENALKDYYKAYSSFLHYQHGVWVLAHGRSDLVQGMDIVGTDIVQVDTDSVKHVDVYRKEFEALNQKIIEKAESFDVKPYAIKNGHKHYLGVWEHEGEEDETTYHKYKTLGAKKYASENEKGEMSITVAGLAKSASAFFEQKGGLDKFSIGTTVDSEYSGRTCAYYNDMVGTSLQNINGHMVEIGSNIAVKNIPYTLGVTSEWLFMILDGHVKARYLCNFNGAFKNYGENSTVEMRVL